MRGRTAGTTMSSSGGASTINRCVNSLNSDDAGRPCGPETKSRPAGSWPVARMPSTSGASASGFWLMIATLQPTGR